MSNGNVLKIPTSAAAKFNISEELNRSGCWTSIEPQQQQQSTALKESTKYVRELCSKKDRNTYRLVAE
jgi:hypothetical protein